MVNTETSKTSTLLESEMAGQTQIRNVCIRGVVYARVEDVVEIIKEVASAEETDVRNRFNELADNLGKLQP